MPETFVHWMANACAARGPKRARRRREAAECVEVSASSAIKWMQRLNETGSIAAKAERRQHLAAGGARGRFAGADCRAGGFDVG